MMTTSWHLTSAMHNACYCVVKASEGKFINCGVVHVFAKSCSALQTLVGGAMSRVMADVQAEDVCGLNCGVIYFNNPY